MRLLWLDQVLELRARQRIRARLDLAADDPAFAYHFPARPVLPASALVEAFAQAATILIEPSHGFEFKALPGYISSARFYRPVEPGRALDLELVVEQWSRDGAVLRGRAEQDGARRATCVLGMLTAPLADFYGAPHLPMLRTTYERLLAGAILEGFDRHPLEPLAHAVA